MYAVYPWWLPPIFWQDIVAGALFILLVWFICRMIWGNGR